MKMQEFTIKDLESFTGIKAHTIRIWEQRYGLLTPDRTQTGIRKYTDKDLKFLLNVSLLANLGHKISSIAQMSDVEIREAIQKAQNNQSEDHIFHVLKISMLNFDEELFSKCMEERIAQSGLMTTFIEVIVPFMRQVGIMWQASAICPAQEHFISALVRQKIFSHIDRLPVPPASDRKPIVLFLPELEIHEISLVMMHYVIKSKGLRSIFLGQSVPFEDLKEVQQRIGEADFVSIFTTNPSPILLPDYFKRLMHQFSDQGCHFYLTGSILHDVKSPDPSIISIFPSADALIGALQ